MPSSDDTSPAPVHKNGRAGQAVKNPAARAASNGHGNGRPHLTDAAKLTRARSTAVQLGPNLYRVAVSAGVWAMSTDESPDAPLPRGLYQQERGGEDEEPRWAHRSELPYVHSRIVRRDGSGNRITLDYLISGTKVGPRVLVSPRVVRSGDWAGPVGLDPAADRKVIDAAATAIFRMRPLARDFAGEREAVPRVGPDGKITVPVAETLPAGYFLAGPLSRAEAIARWRTHIVPVAVANPKMALVMGAAAVSPFVGCLDYCDVRAFVVDLACEVNGGKSTVARTAGAIWGAAPKDGSGVVGSWNLSAQGPGRALGMLGCLPAIFDEQGISGYTGDQWARIILSITDGSRRAADREGGLRVTLPYSGVVISAGNASISAGLGAGKYAGIGPKRVNTFDGPFTGSAEQAESVKPVLRDAFGHPGQVIAETFTAPEVGKLVTQAAGLIGLPSGVIARSAAKNMHLLTAGAAMLDAVFGTGTALRDAAAVAARDYLAENGHDPEHDSERLLTALRDSLASQPARWPTVAEYREHRLPKPNYAPDGSLANSERVELPQHNVDRNLAGVRADDGSWFAVFGPALDELLARIGADRSVALAEADKRGWLNVAKSVRRAGKLATPVSGIGRMYRFDLAADDDGQDHEPEPAPGLAPAPAAPESPRADRDRCPACEYALPMHAFDCPDLSPLPPDYGESEPEAQELAEPERQAAEPVTATAQDGPALIDPPFALAVRAYLAECAGAGLDPRYHPTADGAVKMIVHHGRAEADAIREAFASLAGQPTADSVTAAPEMAEPEPASPAPADDTAPAPEPAQERSEPRREVTGDDELEAFTREMLSAYPDAESGDIDAALDLFHEAYGLRFIRSASWTGITTLRRDVALFGAKSAPEPRSAPVLSEIRDAGPFRHVAFVVPGQTVRPGRHFTGWDINGCHPAAAGSAYLGTGEPEYVVSPRTIAPFLSGAGYVQLGRRLSTGHPAYGTLAKGEWVTMPHVKFLASVLGLEVTAAGVAYWGRGNASKHLATFTARYRKARELLNGRTGLPAEYAGKMVKAVANKTIGMLRSEDHNKTEFYTPDWYDQVVSTAEANLLRHLGKIEAAGGGKPIGKCADGAWWISATERERPAGLEESAQLGKWKLEKWGPVTPAIAEAYRVRDPGALQSAIKSADTARKDGRP